MALADLDPRTESLLLRVARYLVANELERFDRRRIHQSFRAHEGSYVSSREFQEIVRLLAALGCLTEKRRRTGRRGRQPTPEYTADLPRLRLIQRNRQTH